MKKITAMLPYLILDCLVFYLSLFVITDTGSGMLLLLVIVPLLIFIISLFYGKNCGFNLLYPILLAVLLLPILGKNTSLGIYIVLFPLDALLGTGMGAGFNHKHNIHAFFKFMLSILAIIFTVILILFGLNLFIFKSFFPNQDNIIHHNVIHHKHWEHIFNLDNSAK